jgi:polysaccharide biosynthesis protein PslH
MITETSADTSRSMNLDSHHAEPAQARRRILVCTPFPPRLDAKHGGKPTAQLLLRLAGRNDVALLSLHAPGEAPVDPALVAKSAHVWEVPLAAGSSIVRRLRWSEGLLRGIPPWATDCRSTDYTTALESVLDEWRPDVVEIHLQAMAQYVDAPVRRGLPTVLVDYDPGSAWAEDVARMTRGPRRVVRRVEVSAWRRYERATRGRFDAIVVFAERDVAAVAPTAGDAWVTRVPLSVELPAQPLDPEGAEPPTILFVGSFVHPPNVDAALWLAQTIFPRVATRVPEARLDLVGHEPGARILALAGGTVSVHGSVPDVTPYADRAAVVVAPIRIGGSMRGKVLEALAQGKALVATSRAAEGLDAVAGQDLLIADREDEIVDALVRLLQDRGARGQLGENARTWAEAHLGWDDGVIAFEHVYDTVVAKRTLRVK